MTAAATLAKLPVEKRETMVSILAVIGLLQKAKALKPRLAHDFNRIIADLWSEIDALSKEDTPA